MTDHRVDRSRTHSPSSPARVDGRHDVAGLLASCRQGEPAAWDQLVTDYERLVFAIARREGLDVHDAGDVCQEVFSTLLASLDSIREPERLTSWLMTVARRSTWKRRVDRTRATSLDPRLDAPDAAYDDPSDALARSLWVHDAVTSLGEPCTSLVRTLFFDPDEPSYAAVALASKPWRRGTIAVTILKCSGPPRRGTSTKADG